MDQIRCDVISFEGFDSRTAAVTRAFGDLTAS
jgi:hypothetical protein